jgi:hypothetical protein
MKKLFVLCLIFTAFFGFAGCGGDDDSGEQAADGGAGIGGFSGGGAGTEPGAGTGGEAGTEPAAGSGGEAGTEPAAGSGGEAGTEPAAGSGGVGGEPVAGDGGVVDVDGAVGGMDASTGSACEELAACCETLPVAERATCRSIVETSLDEGCAVYIPMYCNQTDAGAAVDAGGLTLACAELAACCAIQTNSMIQSFCDGIAQQNDDATCESLLTSGISSLPMVVPCN